MCVRACVCACMHAWVCVCVHVSVFIYGWVCVGVCQRRGGGVHTCSCMCLCAYMLGCVHSCMHVCVCMELNCICWHLSKMRKLINQYFWWQCLLWLNFVHSLNIPLLKCSQCAYMYASCSDSFLPSSLFCVFTLCHKRQLFTQCNKPGNTWFCKKWDHFH